MVEIVPDHIEAHDRNDTLRADRTKRHTGRDPYGNVCSLFSVAKHTFSKNSQLMGFSFRSFANVLTLSSHSHNAMLGSRR